MKFKQAKESQFHQIHSLGKLLKQLNHKLNKTHTHQKKMIVQQCSYASLTIGCPGLKKLIKWFYILTFQQQYLLKIAKKL